MEMKEPRRRLSSNRRGRTCSMKRCRTHMCPVRLCLHNREANCSRRRSVSRHDTQRSCPRPPTHSSRCVRSCMMCHSPLPLPVRRGSTYGTRSQRHCPRDRSSRPRPPSNRKSRPVRRYHGRRNRLCGRYPFPGGYTSNRPPVDPTRYRHPNRSRWRPQPRLAPRARRGPERGREGPAPIKKTRSVSFRFPRSNRFRQPGRIEYVDCTRRWHWESTSLE